MTIEIGFFRVESFFAAKAPLPLELWGYLLTIQPLFSSGSWNITAPCCCFGKSPFKVSRNETFEKCSISFKIKAHENFSHRNISDISRIKIRMQRRDWAKGGVFQRSHYVDCRHYYNLFAAMSRKTRMEIPHSLKLHHGGVLIFRANFFWAVFGWEKPAYFLTEYRYAFFLRFCQEP